MNVRVVVPTTNHVPASTLEQAIMSAIEAGGGVQVVLPVVLPAVLPIDAAPPRLRQRVDAQAGAVRAALANAGRRGRVDIVQCRSVAALVRAVCHERQPCEVIFAGGASWMLRRSLHGVVPVTVISGGRTNDQPRTIRRQLVGQSRRAV